MRDKGHRSGHREPCAHTELLSQQQQRMHRAGEMPPASRGEPGDCSSVSEGSSSRENSKISAFLTQRSCC